MYALQKQFTYCIFLNIILQLILQEVLRPGNKATINVLNSSEKFVTMNKV